MKFNNNMNFINLSPWPILLTFNSMNLIFSINFMLNFKIKFMLINILMFSNMMILWNFYSLTNKMILGYKNLFMNLSIKMTTFMFIISELMFFSTFFYIYFSNKFFFNLFYKNFYLKMFKLNFLLSLLNLMILLSSSITFTIFIKINLMKNKSNNKFIIMTMNLGMYFILIQIFEYLMMNFNISNSMFMTNFFILTSFHMNHVTMGLMMILFLMMTKNKLMNNNFIKMMSTCLYWHFIDLIWILIFFIIYYFNNMTIMINFQLKNF